MHIPELFHSLFRGSAGGDSPVWMAVSVTLGIATACGCLLIAARWLQNRFAQRNMELEQVVAELQTEVAQRKAAAELLADERNILHTLIDTLPDLVYVKDMQGRYVLNNPAHLQFFGASSPEEIAGKSVFDLFPRELAEQYHADDCAVMHGGQTLLSRLEPTVDHAGNRMWVLRTKVPLRNHDGTIIGLVGVARDVTQSQAAEEALKGVNETLEQRVAERSAAAEQRTLELAESARALREQTNILRSILDGMADGVVVADAAGKMLLCNPAAEFLLGITSEGGSCANWLTGYDLLLPDALTPFPIEARPLVRALRGESVDEVEAVVRQTGPDKLWLSASARPLKDENGTVWGGVVVFHDMTDRKRVEAEVQQAKEAAEAANRAKSEFLANMSHEIRTPMSAIIGYADILLKRPHTLSEQQECLQIIQRNGRHLLNLINDILDISKIEAGQMTVEHIACDLPRALADVVSMMRPRAVEKGLKFDVAFAGPIPRQIRTDPLRLRQILVNLVGNAIKFTPGGQVSLRVTCDASGPNLSLKFDVEDTGIGMSEEDIGRLFRPFTQADESTTRRFGGTGLGLTISRRLADLLGGNVAVRSQRGVGSTFTATIDAGSSAALEWASGLSEATLPAPTDCTISQQVKLAGRILLAEDGRDNQRLISAFLGDAGAEVFIAENGRIAVDLAMRETFDLILMDMQMPELDGYGATAELRRLGNSIPIVALTAHAMAEDRAKCMASGCSDYLTKPVDSEVLLRTIAHHLHQTPSPRGPAAPAAAPIAPETPLAPALPLGAGRIRSSFSDVRKMRTILDEYVVGLPAQVVKLTESLARKELDTLRRIAHQLRGSGGGFGFAQITESAASVEDMLKQNQELDAIAAQVDELVRIIRRVEGYDQGTEMPTVKDAPSVAR